jgi:flagellar motor switch protein FliG
MVGGIHAMAEVLNNADKSNENLILAKIEELNPQLSVAVRRDQTAHVHV